MLIFQELLSKLYRLRHGEQSWWLSHQNDPLGLHDCKSKKYKDMKKIDFNLTENRKLVK